MVVGVVRTSAFFDREVGVQVGVGRLDRFVPEPHGDDGGVDAGVQQAHRRGVAQGARGHVLAVEVRQMSAAVLAFPVPCCGHMCSRLHP